jgi:membrane protein implicated in regulation of membrane protease activity
MSLRVGDGFGSPADQGVATLFFLGAFLLGWIAFARLRRGGFPRLPMGVAWAAAVLALVSLALALLLPPAIRKEPTKDRPTTAARLTIVSPQEGQIFRGDPATVEVRLVLTGGRIVTTTSGRLVPDEGHVHLFLDGFLVSMTGLTQQIDVAPGSHSLEAEFVAVDHLPFDPRVRALVSFSVEG